MSEDKDTNALIKELRSSRPMDWEELPDIGLYMDQLLTYVNRQQPFTEEEDQGLTKSMVNNYIKQEIIARPHGKRYTQEHVTSLTMLSMLKEVLPIQVCQTLFEMIGIREDTKAVYEHFQETFNWCMNTTADALADFSEESDEEKILRLALFSYAARRAAITLLERKDAERKEAEEESDEK